MGRFKDLTGQKFGRLTVIKRAGTSKSGKVLWLCECSCEEHNQITTTTSNLVTGNTKSCGCLAKENASKVGKANTVHGDTDSRLYRIFRGMKDRCYNSKNKDYVWYGGKGIKICEEWKNNYAVFKNWAINNGYKETLTIERKDFDKDYCPENCEWITIDQQQRNKSSNRLITYNGETMILVEWAEKFNIPYKVLCARINDRGHSFEEAINMPYKRRS